MARARTAPVLIVSAFAPELAPLQAWLDAPAQRALRAGLVCRPAGIGAVDAAAGTAEAIAQTGPRAVVFVGTAGSYGERPAVGSVAVAERVCLAATAVVRGDGYLPGPMVHALSADAELRRALRRSGGAYADVATTLAITRRRALAARLSAATGATVENLEAFAAARAAARAGVPFAAVLGIANRVGPNAHREWLANAQAATVAACSVLQKWLSSEDTLTAPTPADRRRRRAASGRRRAPG